MVFPLADDNRDRIMFPYVNIALIAINVFVFVVLQGLGTNEKFTMAFSTVPAEIITGKDISRDIYATVQIATGEIEKVKVGRLEPLPFSLPVYITLLTSMFMHGSLAHIGGNMWFLWIFGDNIENDLGRVRYLAFYLLTGLLASLTHVFLSASGDSAFIPSLGASGAISGVMGGYLVLHPKRQVTVLMFRFITQVPGFVAVGLWFAFQIVSSLQVMGGRGDGVAYGAHIGGFIAGAALVKLFTLGLPQNKPLTDTMGPASYGRPRDTDRYYG